MAFGSKINASHLRPKRSGILTGAGYRSRSGAKSREVHIHDEDEKPVCVSRCGLVVVEFEYPSCSRLLYDRGRAACKFRGATVLAELLLTFDQGEAGLEP